MISAQFRKRRVSRMIVRLGKRLRRFFRLQIRKRSRQSVIWVRRGKLRLRKFSFVVVNRSRICRWFFIILQFFSRRSFVIFERMFRLGYIVGIYGRQLLGQFGLSILFYFGSFGGRGLYWEWDIEGESGFVVGVGCFFFWVFEVIFVVCRIFFR